MSPVCRVCRRCGESKEATDQNFYRNHNGKRVTFQATCRKCKNAKALAYQGEKRSCRNAEVGRAPGTVCEACEQVFVPVRLAAASRVWDHNHATGKFRGWICSRCNLVLGHVKDSASVLNSLANYLQRN